MQDSFDDDAKERGVLTVGASVEDGSSVEDGTGAALLTWVEDGCEPPWVPEGEPAISM